MSRENHHSADGKTRARRGSEYSPHAALEEYQISVTSDEDETSKGEDEYERGVLQVRELSSRGKGVARVIIEDSKGELPVCTLIRTKSCATLAHPRRDVADDVATMRKRKNKRVPTLPSELSPINSAGEPSPGSCEYAGPVIIQKKAKRSKTVNVPHVVRVRRGQENTSTDVADNAYPHYRCNIQTAIRELQAVGFRKAHIEALKTTPFWYLIDAFLSMTIEEYNNYRKYDSGIAAIIRCFYGKSATGERGFLFGSSYVCPHRDHFELVFGIRDGSIPIYTTSCPGKEFPFIRRCWPNIRAGTLLTKKQILAVLHHKVALDTDEPNVVDDIARLVHMYLLAVLFMPNQNSSVKWNILKYIDNLAKICMYDWSAYILEYLLVAIQKTKTLKVGGCTVFLLFWLCEICPLIDPNNSVHQFPRFRNWSLFKLRQETEFMDLSRIHRRPGIYLDAFNFTAEEILMLDSISPPQVPVVYRQKIASINNSKDVTDADIEDALQPNPPLVDAGTRLESVSGKPCNGVVQCGTSQTVHTGNNQGSVVSGNCMIGGYEGDNQYALWEEIMGPGAMQPWDEVRDAHMSKEKSNVQPCGSSRGTFGEMVASYPAVHKADEYVLKMKEMEAEVNVYKEKLAVLQAAQIEYEAEIRKLAITNKDAIDKLLGEHLELEKSRAGEIENLKKEVRRLTSSGSNPAEYEKIIIRSRDDFLRQLADKDTELSTMRAEIQRLTSSNEDRNQHCIADYRRCESLQSEITELQKKRMEEKLVLESTIKELEAIQKREADWKEVLNNEKMKLHLQVVETAKRQKIIDNLDIGDAGNVDADMILTSAEINAVGVVGYTHTPPSIDDSVPSTTQRLVRCAGGIIIPDSNPSTARIGDESTNLTPAKTGETGDTVSVQTPSSTSSINRTGIMKMTPVRPVTLFDGPSPVYDKTPVTHSHIKTHPATPSRKKQVRFDDSISSRNVTVSSTSGLSIHGDNDDEIEDAQRLAGNNYVTPPRMAQCGISDPLESAEAWLKSESPLTAEAAKEQHQDRNVKKAVEVIYISSSAESASTPTEFSPKCHLPAVISVGHLFIGWLVNKFRFRNPSDTILKVSRSALEAEINLNDFELIIHHKPYNDSIVDAWGLFQITKMWGLRKAKETRISTSEKPFLFKSTIWLYVARYNDHPKYAEAADRYIDKKIPEAMKYENWLLPVNTTGGLNPHTHTADHWTLLQYNVNKNLWTFYNSLGGLIEDDEHFKAADILIDYITSGMKRYCQQTGVRVPIYNQVYKKERSGYMPIQARGTVDCGPLVCYVIESIVWNKRIEPDPWSIQLGGQFRAHMAKLFYEAIIDAGIV